MKLPSLLGFFLGALVLAGCGSSVPDTQSTGAGGAGGVAGAGNGGSTGSNTTVGSGGGGGTGGGGPVEGTESLTFGPVTIPSGTENTQCIQARLKNVATLRAHQIHNVLSQGSHHMIVYKTSETQEKLVPYDCQPFVDTLNPDKGLPLMITQKHDETLTLPEGVAFSMDPEQMIRLEVHYVNASANEIELTATANFIPIHEKDYKYDAGLLFLGNPDVNIPPMTTATLGPVFLPLGQLIPEIVGDAKFFALTGHTHQWGTNVTVNLAKDKFDPGNIIYYVPDWSWAEPETVKLDPEITLAANGGFRLSCQWDNKSPQTVQFGESANDEMCFFWAYYYPSKGAFVCAHTDQFGGADGINICCPGSPLCSQLFTP